MSLDVNINEPEEFESTELHKCIENIVSHKGIHDFTYQVDYISEKVDNLVANLFRVVITDEEKDETFNVILKTLINTERKDLFTPLHEREIKAYEEIFPVFIDLQRCLEISERIVLPEKILSNEKEVLVLKDMTVEGFKCDENLNNYKNFSYEKVNKIINELAKLHGLSFAYKNHDQSKFSRQVSSFGDIIYSEHFVSKSVIKDYYFESFEMSINLVSNKEIKEKLLQLRPKLIELLTFYVQPNEYSVLCHGDIWAKNMLYKYEVEQDFKVCFVDFQTMRYASPTTDIIYFLYLCTDAEFRSRYFEDLKKSYYFSLASFLKRFDIDVNVAYPKENFDCEINEMLEFGLLASLIELRVITHIPETEASLKSVKLASEDEYIQDEINLFKIRVNDVVKDSVDNGVIDKLLIKLANLEVKATV